MKTSFVDGTIATPAFLNAINSPTWSQTPDADGEFLPPVREELPDVDLALSSLESDVGVIPDMGDAILAMPTVLRKEIYRRPIRLPLLVVDAYEGSAQAVYFGRMSSYGLVPVGNTLIPIISQFSDFDAELIASRLSAGIKYRSTSSTVGVDAPAIALATGPGVNSGILDIQVDPKISQIDWEAVESSTAANRTVRLALHPNVPAAAGDVDFSINLNLTLRVTDAVTDTFELFVYGSNDDSLGLTFSNSIAAPADSTITDRFILRIRRIGGFYYFGLTKLAFTPR